MPPDTSAIDAALLETLRNDPTLRGLAPNGVFFDAAPAGSTRFVIVSLVDAADIGQLGGPAYEDLLYAVEYRELKQVAVESTARAAAQRIRELLDDQPLTVTGYTWMTTHRERPERFTEVDDLDASIKWNRRGGQYRVQMAVG